MMASLQQQGCCGSTCGEATRFRNLTTVPNLCVKCHVRAFAPGVKGDGSLEDRGGTPSRAPKVFLSCYIPLAFVLVHRTLKPMVRLTGIS